MWTTRLPAHRWIPVCFKPETMLRIIAQVKREGYNFAISPSFGLAHVHIILLRVLNVLMGLETEDRWFDATTVLPEISSCSFLNSFKIHRSCHFNFRSNLCRLLISKFNQTDSFNLDRNFLIFLSDKTSKFYKKISIRPNTINIVQS